MIILVPRFIPSASAISYDPELQQSEKIVFNLHLINKLKG